MSLVTFIVEKFLLVQHLGESIVGFSPHFAGKLE